MCVHSNDCFRQVWMQGLPLKWIYQSTNLHKTFTHKNKLSTQLRYCLLCLVFNQIKNLSTCKKNQHIPRTLSKVLSSNETTKATTCYQEIHYGMFVSRRSWFINDGLHDHSAHVPYHHPKISMSNVCVQKWGYR